jgi:Peptidase S24-like
MIYAEALLRYDSCALVMQRGPGERWNARPALTPDTEMHHVQGCPQIYHASQNREPINRGERSAFADAYETTVPDRSMEPRLVKGCITQVSPSRPPRSGDEVLVELKDGNVRMAELISLGRKTVKLTQLNPRRTSTLSRSEIGRLHVLIGCYTRAGMRSLLT